jgi:hypothetical protein
MPVLCKAINTLTDCHVNAASFYRISRGEAAGVLHKGFTVYKSERDLEFIKKHCQDASRTLIFIRSPEKWKFKIEKGIYIGARSNLPFK